MTLTPQGTGEVNIAAGNLNYAGTAVTSTGAELNYLDGVVLGTPTASKAVIADANKNIGAVKGTELHIGTSGSETQVTATAAELNTYILNTRIDDISTASSCFVIAPKAGTISKIYSIINGTTSTADAVITAKVSTGTDITNTLTIANSSSAADIDIATPSDNNAVSAGDYIKLTTDGGSTNTVSAVFTIEITY
jgi:hypothetical protein